MMNEQSAREIALVRAVESTDRAQRLLGTDERTQASRGAREFSRWQAADAGAAAAAAAAATGSDILYLQKRSALLLDRLGARHPALAALRRPGRWHVWAGVAAPLAALLTGAVAERVVNPQRVDLLSGALLLIVAWNLVVYLGLLLWPLVARRFANGAVMPAPPPALVRWLTAPRGKEKSAAGASDSAESQAALLAFGRDWARVSRPLAGVRVARIMHLSAALFALGAIGSLYLRGIVSEYRVGWESTFLDAGQVFALLSWVFWPVRELLGMQPFTVEQIAALQFGRQPALPTASGAHWVHMYAALLALVVIVPRLLLAAFAWATERRLAQSFAPDLNEPYFRRLLAAGGQGAGAALRVLPYSFSVDQPREQGLREVAAQLLGDDARLVLRPSVGYGANPDQPLVTPTEPADRSPDPALTLALFNLAATPERENHGAFIDYVVAAAPLRRSAVLIDESSLSARLGSDRAAADRLLQRRGLWRRFCELHDVPVAFVDLLDPSLSGIEHDLGPRVATAPAMTLS